jgi:hypothetical protein
MIALLDAVGGNMEVCGAGMVACSATSKEVPDTGLHFVGCSIHVRLSGTVFVDPAETSLDIVDLIVSIAFLGVVEVGKFVVDISRAKIKMTLRTCGVK